MLVLVVLLFAVVIMLLGASARRDNVFDSFAGGDIECCGRTRASGVEVTRVVCSFALLVAAFTVSHWATSDVR